MVGISNKNYMKRTSRYVTGPCPRFVRGAEQEHVSIFEGVFVVWGGIDNFCPTTIYSPFMNYLQNQLISNSHCSNHYPVYACVGDGYCELLVNFIDFLFIVHVILLFQIHP